MAAARYMLQGFRKFFSSKFGVGVSLGFVVLLMLAFAGGDIASQGGFGAFARGNKVATVGGEKITTDDLRQQTSVWIERLRGNNPSFTIKDFLAQDGLNELLNFLIDAKATRLWGEKYGIYIGDRLIDFQIAQDQRVQGPDGLIDADLYRNFLRSQGMTDSQFRTETAELLMARQLLGPATLGVTVPKRVAKHYANVLTERRRGVIIALPLGAFAPAGPLSDAEVQSYYDKHKGNYALPERRTIRYVVYSDAAIGAVPAPNDAEVAALYNTKKADFAPTDKRKLTQVILPTEAAAKAVLAETSGGKKLEDVVAAKGLAAAPLGSLTKEQYSAQANAQVAEAVFGAATGKVVGPYKVSLGWVVVRVDARETTPGKTLDQARPELVKQLTDEKRRAAILEYSARIEDELGSGGSLGDVAKSLGLEVKETPLLLADGSVFGNPETKAPAELAKVLPTAFQLDGPGNAQLAEVEPGKTFVIFDVGQLQPAAPPPLAEIRAQVAEDARIAKGEAGAKAAAQKLQADLEKGVPVEAAIAKLGVALPPVDRVDMERQEVEQKGASTPKPVQLLFTMPKGKVKLLKGPRNQPWYVVTVTEVIPGNVADNDERLVGLDETLRKAKAAEYTEELRGAFRTEIGSSRDQENVGKLQGQLAGGN